MASTYNQGQDVPKKSRYQNKQLGLHVKFSCNHLKNPSTKIWKTSQGNFKAQKNPAVAGIYRCFPVTRHPGFFCWVITVTHEKPPEFSWIQLEMKVLFEKEAFCENTSDFAFYGWISGGFQPCMAEKLDTKNTCCWNAGTRLLDGTPLSFQLSIWIKYPALIKKQLISLAAQASKIPKSSIIKLFYTVPSIHL